jgi:hypothetical protein
MADQPRPIHACACPTCSRRTDPEVAGYHAAINAVAAGLDERNRRLFAALLASRRGHGGVTLLARVTGLSRTTILRGQRELRRGLPPGTAAVRRPGGGRPRAGKKARPS